jgi:hypothetical protein
MNRWVEMQGVDIMNRLDSNRMKRRAVVLPANVHHTEMNTDAICPAGTVTVLVGTRGSSHLRSIEDAIRTENASAFDAAVGELPATKLSPIYDNLSPARAASAALAAGSYFDLKFLGRPILSNVFVNEEFPLTGYSLPFAGGELEAGSFEVTHYISGPSVLIPHLLIIARQPRLTEQEEAFLRVIPADARVMQLGDGDVVRMSTPAIAATVTAGLVGAAVGYALGRALTHFRPGKTSELEIFDTESTIQQFAIAPDAPSWEFINAKRAALR